MTPPLSPDTHPLDERSVFRTLFSAYPDALLLADASGTIVLANPAAAQLLGYTLDELTGLTVDALVPDSIRPRHAAYREAYAHSPRARPMGTHTELVAKRRDGSEVMVEIALSPLQDQGLPYVVAAIRDIGAYPRVKQALQRARYSEYVAQMGRVAVDARDTQALLQQVPAAAAEALEIDVCVVYLLEPSRMEFRVTSGVGLLPDMPVGATVPNTPDTLPGFVVSQGAPVLLDDLHSETRFQVPPSWRAAGLRTGLAVPLSDRGRVIGSLSVRSRKVRQFGPEEVRFLEALANLLAACLQRVQTEEALSHSQRLESVGQLTGGIAHDFNNLLTVIQGNLQVLDEHPAVSQDGYARQLVAAATRASRRGAELTSKLLAFSRRQVLQPREVDVHAMLRSLADMLRRTLDQRIGITVDPGTDCVPCLADPGQLESALLNIAINARDAMPEGGELRFRCGHCEMLPERLWGENEPAGANGAGYAFIAISDTGVGMPEAVKERVFEPFFTTKDAGRGTGLGMATVYGFVKQSRGAIALDSAPGEGTTVTLYLPRFMADANAPRPGPTHAATSLPRLRVLLVEDEPEVRNVAQAFLTSLGCTVSAFANAEQALAHLAGDEAYDLLLSDIALGPGMRGTELARLVREQHSRLAVLLMSGYSSDLLTHSHGTPLAWDLLRKPYTRADLAQAIAKVMREH